MGMVMLRWLLFPFSIIYWLIGSARNALYSYRILQSKQPTIPSICIGNLSVGGTGKSPMTNYLIQLLKSEQKVIVLSRGYGRSSSGFLLVNESHSSQDVGDEPLAYKLEHSESISVAVEEINFTDFKSVNLKACSFFEIVFHLFITINMY